MIEEGRHELENTFIVRIINAVFPAFGARENRRAGYAQRRPVDLRNQASRFRCPLHQARLCSRHHLRQLVESRSCREQTALPRQNSRRLGLLRRAVHGVIYQRAPRQNRGLGTFLEEG